MMNSESIIGKVGLPPGTLIHVGTKKTDRVRIRAIDYDPTIFEALELSHTDSLASLRDSETVTWINVDGLHDVDLISRIGKEFDLHPLLLEDILNTQHRPKVEEFEDCIFITLKMLGLGRTKEIVTEQISLVLGDNWVLSFQEQEGDVFDDLRRRLENPKAATRSKGADYLLYRLLDTVVDGYFLVTDHIESELDVLEDAVLHHSSEDDPTKIQQFKKDLVVLRKAISPLKEAVSTLQSNSSSLIKPGTLRYLGDVDEHLIQASENVEHTKDMLLDLRDTYQAGLNNRLNEVMKVLTIMSTIFIPMTFIAGIYGMNFQYMPELQWKHGYFGALGLMVIIPIIMLIYFKKRAWI